MSVISPLDPTLTQTGALVVSTDAATTIPPGAAESSTTGAGDTATISEEGRRLAQALSAGTDSTEATESGDDADETSDKTEERIKDLQEKIAQIQAEIQEIQNQDLPDELKQHMLAAKQSELLQLLSQLMELQEQNANGISGYRGGTRAEGFSPSLT